MAVSIFEWLGIVMVHEADLPDTSKFPKCVFTFQLEFDRSVTDILTSQRPTHDVAELQM